MDSPDGEGQTDRSDDGAVSRRNVVVGVAIAFVMAVTGFGIALSARGGGGGGETAPSEQGATPIASTPPTDPSADAPTEAPADAPVGPIVTEIDVPIVAPIGPGEGPRGTGLPSFDPDDVGGPMQTSAVDVLSPIVGEATIAVVADESGSGGGAAAAPPVLADELGLPVPDIEVLLDDDREPADTTDGPDLDLAAIERFVGTGATPPTDESTPTASEGVDVEPGRVEPGFVDPCADVDRDVDADGDTRCPDPGEPGTITDTFALTIPPPLHVVIRVRPTDGCAAPVADDEVRVSIESTTPIESMTLRYWRSGWPSDDRTIEIATPNDVTAEWLDAFEAAEVDPPPPIVHCATLTDLFVGRPHQYTAQATDVFDQLWSTRGTPPFFRGPDYRIPKTFLLTLSDNELLVSAPHRADQQVRIYAFRRTSEPTAGDPCSTTSRTQPGYELPWSPTNPQRSTSNANDLARAGFDPAYNNRTFGTMRLAEGSTYRLCIYTSVVEPSFDAGIERIEAYDLITPDALDITFTVVEVETTDDARVRPGTLRIGVEPVGRGIMLGHPWCGTWRNSSDIRGLVAIDEPICTSDARSTALYRSGARVTMIAEDVDGVDHTLESVLRVHTCVGVCVPPESELYRLELPTGAPRRDFWCGGVGDACDRPSDESYGTVVIEVSYANTQGDLRSDWSISLPDELGDQRPEPPETPRFDTSATPLTSGPQPNPTVSFQILADRPVTATVTLLDPTDGSPACIVGGGPNTASFDVLREQHDVAIDNLCPRHSYAPVVELTDADGDTSRWHLAPGDPRFGPAEPWLRGFLRTDDIDLVFTASISIDAPTSMMRVNRADLVVAGRDVIWSSLNEQPRGATGCRGGEVTTTARRAPRIPTDRITTSSGLEVDVRLDVEVELLIAACQLPVPGFEQPGPLAIAQTIAYDDIVFGSPITVTGSIPVAGLPDPDATVDVVAVVTFIEGTP